MFREFGNFISRWSGLVLACWLMAFVWLRVITPPFSDVARGGEFVFLPDNMPSRQGESLLGRAFPQRKTTSNIVVLVYRDDGSNLTEADFQFIHDELKPALEKMRDQINEPKKSARNRSETSSRANTGLVMDIHTSADHGIGKLLTSLDQKASLVTVDLSTDFQDPDNWPAVQSATEIIGKFEQGTTLPQGLRLALTGSAILGRDILQAEIFSARNIGPLTIAIVIVLLTVIYRAPFLVLAPLITLFISLDVSLRLLTLLAEAGYVSVFRGLEVYTTVITYGPGVDYCLFLIARYKENIPTSQTTCESLARSIGQVGSAIAASAATVICGIGMLTFAKFGKFHEAGVGISIALTVTSLATLTLTPSLLCLLGRWAFWPQTAVHFTGNQASSPQEQIVVQRNFFQPMWSYMGQVIERYPLYSLTATLAGLCPFVVLGVMVYHHVNYSLLESLPKTATSSVGTHLLEKHFPVGITGPINVLLQNPNVDFRESDGIAIVSHFVEEMKKRRDEMKIDDIRSVSSPLGLKIQETHGAEESSEKSFFAKVVEKKDVKEHSIEYYVTNAADLSGHVTEIDIILSTDPFSLESIKSLNYLASEITSLLPAEQRANSSFAFVGPTASVRDVEVISQSDQGRIFTFVIACVFIILVVLLRAVSLSIYLLFTVLASFIATIGFTWLVFYGLDPKGFTGLDWTVPVFLFVVLIAVGEDYNIFLVTRVREEQIDHGPKKGILIALTRTGGIITSCGFIMAGTFSSLCVGSLSRMQHLGVALAFGVLLDTFIVRPILVPSFLFVLNDERYGNLGRFLK